MADLYPTEKEITLFGEKLKYPGLKDGKFTNGSFTDPKQLASFIPAETLNLILDNLGEAIKSVGLEPNNTDIDQLKKAITKSEIKQEILKKLVVFNFGYTDEYQEEEAVTLYPDGNGIIYSQDINLKSALAKKINQNEKNIEIINFNLKPAPNPKMYLKGLFTVPFSAPYNNHTIRYSADSKFILEYSNTNNRDINYAIAIQVADDFTEDIADFIAYPAFQYLQPYEQLATKYKAAILSTIIGKSVNLFTNGIKTLAIADLFGISDINIDQKLTPSATTSIEEYIVGGYNAKCYKDLYKNPSVALVCESTYDVSSKLLYGDNIKVRIKLILGDSAIAFMYRAYNVAVRYRIINNYS